MKLLALYRKNDSWVNDQILILHFSFLIYFDWLSAVIQAFKISKWDKQKIIFILWHAPLHIEFFWDFPCTTFHVILLITTKYIYSTVPPSIWWSLRAKLLVFSLLWTTQRCISGLFLPMCTTGACSWFWSHAIATFLVADLPCTTIAIQHEYHASQIPSPLFST